MIYIFGLLVIPTLSALLWAIFWVPKHYSQKTETVKAQAEMDRINQMILETVEAMPTTLSTYHITVHVAPKEISVVTGTDLTERHFKKIGTSEEYSTVHLQRTLLTEQIVSGVTAYTFVFLGVVLLMLTYFE